MKKLLLLALLACCSSLSRISFAQTSIVTATVVDSDATTWTNGTWSLSFVPASSTSINQYSFNGVPLNPSILFQKGTLNSSGALSITLYNNNVISPVGSSWNLTVCPQASAPCGSYNLAVASGSVDISSNLTSILPAPRFKAIQGAYGYADVEAIITFGPGATYWNVTGSVQKYWNGSTWIAGNGTGILSYPPAGIAISTGAGWSSSLTPPVGAIADTSSTQTFTNKSVDGVTPTVFGYLDVNSSIQGQLDSKLLASATVNSKPLNTNPVLTASDVGALSAGQVITYTAPTVNTIPRVSNATSPGTVVDSAFTDDGANTGDNEPLYMSNSLNLNPLSGSTSNLNSNPFYMCGSYKPAGIATTICSQQYLWVGSGTNPAVLEDHYYPAGLGTITVLYAQNTANVATSTVSWNTPKFILRGNTYNGTTGIVDDWSLQGINPIGPNPTSTLVVTHVGTTGSANVQMPGLILTGIPYFATGLSTNTDPAGELVFSAVTTGVYTFINGYLVHPECWAMPQFDPGSGVRMWITYAADVTSMTVHFSSAVTGNVSYGCVGRD